MPRRLTVEQYFDGVVHRDRSVLGRAISLVESKRPTDRRLADVLIERCLQHPKQAIRIGMTGVPGVGKSTMLESFGMMLVNQGLHIAVLAIDPSSSRTGGSILGDKTRMQHLSVHESAFVRPSPTDTHLGGVARKTREAMIICEAAGFDVIIVESVGVGQSEITLTGMVDCFVALMLPNAGDELQGIKKGLLEWVDIIAINKADGSNEQNAKLAQRDFQTAFHYLPPRYPGWQPKVLLTSALHEIGIAELWTAIQEHQTFLKDSGTLQTLRQSQRVEWFTHTLQSSVWEQFIGHSIVRSNWNGILQQVRDGRISIHAAVESLLLDGSGHDPLD